jgi:hypothetical protein
VLVLDERHRIHVVLALDDEDALAGLPVGVRVFQDVEQFATLNRELRLGSSPNLKSFHLT